MSILSTLGLASDKKVRYAIVGLGDIAQEAMMPGFKHTGNSTISAFVTSDAEKARKLADHYDVTKTYSYEQFPELLASGNVDAIYLATPNWRHAEFVIPALQAGIHVLVEKPLEITTQKAEEILKVSQQSKAKLMVAYRLHFEPATLATLDRIRAGNIGDVTLFSSTFTQMVDPTNHRAKSGIHGGPLFDMAPYPLNAARHVFGAEPIEVASAVGTRHPQAGLGDFDDTVAVTLRFPGDRLAQFVVSYYGNTLDSYFVTGAKGNIHVQPAFMYGKPLEYTVTIGGDTEHKAFTNTDHFGGELQYFSECILHDKHPEPDAEEGFADVRVLEAIARALETGQPQKLAPFERARQIDTGAQLKTLRAQSTPALVNASSPSKGMDKAPKN